MTELTTAEAVELAECEQVIRRGLKTFIDVGQALARIRDKRLYRQHYGTFEEYCNEQWDFTKTYVNNLIQADKVTTIVVTSQLPAPKNEAQARELTPLLDKPEELRAAWNEVVSTTEKPTAAKIREVVQRRIADASPKLPPVSPAGQTAVSSSGQIILSQEDLTRQFLPQRLLKEIAIATDRVRAVTRGVHSASPELDAEERDALDHDLAQLAEIITLLRTLLVTGDIDDELHKLLEN